MHISASLALMETVITLVFGMVVFMYSSDKYTACRLVDCLDKARKQIHMRQSKTCHGAQYEASLGVARHQLAHRAIMEAHDFPSRNYSPPEIRTAPCRVL